ncbi:hypothetical protein IKF63_02545 [Candidatus Saccharibacteria bacterium]|nr:hypothetical protein [Candidatus Saccharibacteria bacterium]
MIPSRALRSLPLSAMLSGYRVWGSGSLSSRGTYGYFWSSTPYTYTNSHALGFSSTNVGPKNSYHKPYDFTLRCVAPLFQLPKRLKSRKLLRPLLPRHLRPCRRRPL